MVVNKRKNFVKREEDFVCKNCGFKVEGTGYTNHCPKCLYSLHVDEDVPGDRLSKCLGLMEPVGIEMKKGKYVIIHKCTKCGKIMRNKMSEEDNFDEVVELAKKEGTILSLSTLKF